MTKTEWDGRRGESKQKLWKGEAGPRQAPAPVLLFPITRLSVLWAFIEYLPLPGTQSTDCLPESLEPLILVASFMRGLGASLHASAVGASPVKQRGESFLFAALWGRQ